MARYEYQIVKVTTGDVGSKQLSDLGTIGWRVVAAVLTIEKSGRVAVIMERQK